MQQQGGGQQGGQGQQGGYPQQQGSGFGGGWGPAPAPSRNPWPWIAAAIAVILLGLIAWLLLNRGDGVGEPAAVVVESASETAAEPEAASPSPEASAPAPVASPTPEPAAPAPSPSPEPAQSSGGSADDISDAEPNLQHDIGTIDQVVDDDGVLYVRFNRWQRLEDGASGTDFTEPPRNAGATDVRYIDENPQLRSYPIAPQAFVGEISNYDALCNFQEDEPQYVATDLPTLVQQYPDALFTLTFNEFGEVVDVSDERSC